MYAGQLLEALRLLVPLQLTMADVEASAAEVAAQLVEAVREDRKE